MCGSTGRESDLALAARGANPPAPRFARRVALELRRDRRSAPQALRAARLRPRLLRHAVRHAAPACRIAMRESRATTTLLGRPTRRLTNRETLTDVPREPRAFHAGSAARRSWPRRPSPRRPGASWASCQVLVLQRARTTGCSFWSGRRAATALRARWRALLADATLVSSAAAVSLAEKSRASRRISTARWRGGRYRGDENRELEALPPLVAGLGCQGTVRRHEDPPRGRAPAGWNRRAARRDRRARPDTRSSRRRRPASAPRRSVGDPVEPRAQGASALEPGSPAMPGAGCPARRPRRRPESRGSAGSARGARVEGAPRAGGRRRPRSRPRARWGGRARLDGVDRARAEARPPVRRLRQALPSAAPGSSPRCARQLRLPHDQATTSSAGRSVVRWPGLMSRPERPGPPRRRWRPRPERPALPGGCLGCRDRARAPAPSAPRG